MFNKSRRKLLKSIAYGSALTVGGGLTSVAFALNNAQNKIDKAVNKATGTALPTCDISIMQQQTSGKEIVTLYNHTNDTVHLDKITPIDLEHVNGSLIVKVNKADNGILSIAAGERLSFEIEAVTANIIEDSQPIPNVLAGHLKIQSEHPDFNGIIPVTVFDSQVA
ncbi:MAG: hypothetical protein V3U71_11410 [Cocleimonas sp.]